MPRNCPHCHEETFGWRELITLDSFTVKECKNCHKLVRNSGWRQLLALLAIIAMILAALSLLEFIPSDMEVFLIPVAVVVLPLVLVLLAKPVKAENPETDPAAFTPSSPITTRRSWSRAGVKTSSAGSSMTSSNRTLRLLPPFESKLRSVSRILLCSSFRKTYIRPNS